MSDVQLCDEAWDSVKDDDVSPQALPVQATNAKRPGELLADRTAYGSHLNP